MNSYITIGYKKDGTSKILASPDVPYQKHRELFKTLTGDYADVEMWSRAMGKIKQRKVKPKESKKIKAKEKNNETK